MASYNFDEVLGLEEQFYSDGFQQGLSDGLAAGRIEGRTFGLEKGFEKYIESGKLYGKSVVWANRIPHLQKANRITEPEPVQGQAATSLPQDGGGHATSLCPLPENHRLAKHVQVLHALAESASLSTENTEDAVSDFDDRLKRAQGKAKIIEKIAGECHSGALGNA